MATVIEFITRVTSAEQVKAELGKTEKAVVSLGRTTSTVNRSAGRDWQLSAEKVKGLTSGLSNMAGISPRVGEALADVATKSRALGAAVQFVGKAFLPVLIIFAAFEALKTLGLLDGLKERFNRLTDSIGLTARATEQWNEEQKKFADERKRFADVSRGLDQQLDILKAQTDEERGLLGVLHAQDAARRQIFAVTQAGAARNALLAKAEGVEVLKREQVIIDSLTRQRAEQTKAAEEQVKRWQTETTALMGELKARLAARQAFEQQLGTGAAGLGQQDSSAAGLRAVAKAREDLTKALRDIAFLERDGLLAPRDAVAERQKLLDAFTKTAEGIKESFRGVPAVIDATNQALVNVQVAPFSTAMQNARDWINANVDSLDTLKGRHEALGEQYRKIVPSTDAAREATHRLTEEYTNLSWAIFSARQQLAFLAGERAAEAATP